jgi:Transcriptional regulators
MAPRATRGNAMKKKVTSKTVAELAGVSQSAVSRTFTPGASVSSKTREKVIKVADSLGYRPNAIARSLSTRSTKLIGLIMARMSEPFYADVLHRFTAVLQEKGYSTLLLHTYAGKDVEQVLSLALQYQVEGLICASSTLTTSLAEQCASRGVPLVVFHRFSEQDGGANLVRCDHFQGGRLLAEELVKSGHRRIAFIAGASSSSTSLEREKGFIEGLSRHDVRLWLRAQVHSYEYSEGVAVARAMLHESMRPDAVFAFNDIMAMAVVDCARDSGLSVPGDLSVVGFDGIEIGQQGGYRLTTIKQPTEEMVRVSVELLMRSIANPGAKFESRVLPGVLLRGSSARLSPEQGQ